MVSRHDDDDDLNTNVHVMRYPICNYLNHQPSHYSGFSRGYRPRMESIEKVEGGANHIAIPEDGMSIVLPSQKDAIEILYKTAREAYFASNAADNKASPWFPLVYIGCMVKLKLNQELFYLGHQLVNSCPNDAVSWYCVGCYYFSCGKLDFAHRYIKRCLKKDPEFFLGWLMLGHILSLQEESEQAVAAYRSAVRLQPNNFFPLLCLGKEFIRTNNLSLAAHTLSGARNLCSVDAHVLNELGVVFVRLERFTEALQFFNWSLSVIQMEQTENQNAIAAASADSQSMKEKMVILKSNYSRSLMGDDQVCEVSFRR